MHLYNNPSNYTTTEISFNISAIKTKAYTNLHLVATGKSFSFWNHQRGSLFFLRLAYQLPPSSWHALAHRIQLILDCLNKHIEDTVSALTIVISYRIQLYIKSEAYNLAR